MSKPALLVSALLSGLVFGLGLLVSGMANPAKVLAFLDVSGAWDPSLMLVMAGAIGLALFAFVAAKRRRISLLGAPMLLPQARQLDLPLLGGSALFGIGWGMAGFCPGPALLGLGLGLPKALLFVAAMLGGMLLHDVIERHRAARRLRSMQE